MQNTYLCTYPFDGGAPKGVWFVRLVVVDEKSIPYLLGPLGFRDPDLKEGQFLNKAVLDLGSLDLDYEGLYLYRHDSTWLLLRKK